MNLRFWTISNILSISRVILLIPIVVLLLDKNPDSRYWALGLMVIAALTDALDGYLARRLKQVTDLGKLLDPLADKICVGVAVVVLLTLGNLPLWFVIVVLARDVLIFLGGTYITKTRRVVLQSSTVGKIAVTIIAIAILFATLNLEQLNFFKQLFVWLSVLMIAVSLVLYGQRFVEVVSKE